MRVSAPRAVARSVEGSVGIITLNAPERMNTLGGDLLPLLNKYCLEADADPDVLCVILTAAGDRAFCAGMDVTAPPGQIGKPKPGAPPPPRRISASWNHRDGTPDIIHGMDTPVICAMNGSAAGYGMDLCVVRRVVCMAPSPSQAAVLNLARRRRLCICAFCASLPPRSSAALNVIETNCSVCVRTYNTQGAKR
jgi:enoyl-CoA hydratase/carnithine racemase